MTLRIAVLGAFQFPVPQGSQVFARDQARALVRAGATVTLVCYGRGVGPTPPDLDVLRIPAPLSPRSHRAGPHVLKPVADTALVAALVRAARQRHFDVVLAHNAEAAWVGIAARALTGVPVVYVAHTLFGRELGSYGPTALAPLLDRAGAAIDGATAARSDAVVTLCSAAAVRLRPRTRGPLAIIPPGLDATQPPEPSRVSAAAERFGLETGGYALYTGNLDAYQGLDDLARDAEHVSGFPIVVATHAAPRHLGAARVVRVEDVETMRALVFGAAMTLLPRPHPAGFPIKVLNYMEAARTIVARTGAVDGLEHDRNAWLVSRDARPGSIARAILHLAAHPEVGVRLGAGARDTLVKQHAWPELARRTLDLCEELSRR